MAEPHSSAASAAVAIVGPAATAGLATATIPGLDVSVLALLFAFGGGVISIGLQSPGERTASDIWGRASVLALATVSGGVGATLIAKRLFPSDGLVAVWLCAFAVSMLMTVGGKRIGVAVVDAIVARVQKLGGAAKE